MNRTTSMATMTTVTGVASEMTAVHNATVDSFELFVTPWEQRVSCAILFSLLSAGGVIVNSLAIGLTLFTDLRKRKPNLFIANLASSDMMCSLVFLCGQNFYILYRETMPVMGCRWLGFLNFIAAMQEFVFPPFLAVNRYISLYHQHVYDSIYTARNMVLMVGSSWTFSTVVPLIFLASGHTGFDKRNEHCCVVVEDDVGWTIGYWLVIILPLLGCCDSTMLFCNWKIYKKLQHHGDNQQTMLKSNVIREHREILGFMIIDMLMPVCAHSVYHVSKFALPDRIPLFTRQFFTCLYLGNSLIRGLIIIIFLRPYRRALRNIFCGCSRVGIEPNNQTNFKISSNS